MTDPHSRFAAFIAELRQRRVFRVAIVYAGVAFIIFQIADFTFPALHVPDWFSSAVVVLLILGFFIAVGLAWAFDLTAEGLVRTRESKRDQPKKPSRPVIGNKTLVVIAAVAVAVAVWSWWGRTSAAGTITSIAVLPLDNLMGDPAEDYFVEGMHEAIITNLARLSELKVISRTSAMRYKDTDKLMPEIARELNVDALVEGSVLKAGNRVRITAQLIHGASDTHLWSNDYEADLTDILSLQKTIARAIAKEIGLALKPEEEAYLSSAPQVNPEAYNLYLKGWHFRNLHTSETMPRAIEYLEQAVALDPGFAQAYAFLAHSYFKMFGYGLWSSDYAFKRMKEAIDKALELDPNQAEAYAHLGVYQYFAEFDIAGAEASYRRAVELSPDNAWNRHEYGYFLWRTGRPDEALAEYRRAQELDPLSYHPLGGISWVYRKTRQYDKALEYILLSQELRTGSPGDNSSIRHEILMQQARYAEVAEQAGINTRVGRRARMAMGNVEEVYAFRDSLRSTGELQQREQEDPFWSARFYAIMGEKEKALGLLERGYEDKTRETFIIEGLVYDPELDSLRAEPRFKDLFQKLGLTEVFDQYGQRIR